MGWAGGSHLLRETWREVRDFIPESRRLDVFSHLAEMYSNEDCDTLHEVICSEWPEVKEALNILGMIDE